MPKCNKDIVIEDIHEFTIVSNDQKLSDNAKKSNVKRIKKKSYKSGAGRFRTHVKRSYSSSSENHLDPSAIWSH